MNGSPDIEARAWVRLALDALPAAPPPVPRRCVRPEDAEALGGLLHAAYRGTVDDEGETLKEAVAEVRATMRGRYGRFLFAASFVVEEEGRPMAASLTTWHDPIGMPLLAYSVTRPDRQRRGLARSLLRATLAALREAGEEDLALAVTLANTPALRLYESLGFERFEPKRVAPDIVPPAEGW